MDQKPLVVAPFFHTRPNYNYATLGYTLRNQEKKNKPKTKLLKKIVSFSFSESTKITKTRAKYTNMLTKFPSRMQARKNNLWSKNYVNLIPLRIRRKPTNKFWMQSQVKDINGLTAIKAKLVNKSHEMAKNII